MKLKIDGSQTDSCSINTPDTQIRLPVPIQFKIMIKTRVWHRKDG